MKIDPNPATLRGTEPSGGQDLPLRGSGEPGGAELHASPGVAVPYCAERLDVFAASEFGSVERALEWCGLDLEWVHFQARPGQSTMVGSVDGVTIAVVRGPLIALVPECVKMEVRR